MWKENKWKVKIKQSSLSLVNGNSRLQSIQIFSANLARISIIKQSKEI